MSFDIAGSRIQTQHVGIALVKKENVIKFRLPSRMTIGAALATPGLEIKDLTLDRFSTWFRTGGLRLPNDIKENCIQAGFGVENTTPRGVVSKCR
jgi:hypothetical protein